eukprot:scaffold139413_cov35-Tisochrysis_lutea.AAC.2
MPVMRIFSLKSFTFGLMVRALTSSEPAGYERPPVGSLVMVGKAVATGAEMAALTPSIQSPRTMHR